MHGAEHAGVKFLLVTRLRCIRHHQIGIALGDLVEDRDIVIVGLDLGVLDIGLGKSFVGSAGVDDDARAGPVDIRDGLVFARVSAARDRASCPRA